MIDALLGGSLAKDPESRTAKNGNPYALVTLRVPNGGNIALFARITAFDAHVRDELLSLGKGDALSVAGPLEVGAWKADNGEVRPSLSMVAHAIVSPYHVKRRRAAIQGSPKARAPHQGSQAPAPANDPVDFLA
ncbi:single-stranded DNA-binding protein [Paraburkholderia sp. MMS20-SJTN17]|uniref:Single-stranded DNA-binding protein n=1 Tax=Paraburkholderia translucens TaxID=2886945 RepID=A0ABS8K880_9BURK|nr:single-stranded DNA-binding protein [Paraburkholderia sp. MMS20-SJTN17]MCC8400953.1 single-stranded DNA-binding protein [Paraburkholderia sp. MMS20-SJTN17]